MSSLIVATDEDKVLVATDTLATHPDGRPFKFTTKAFIVPHLKLIMACTGLAGFLGRWFIRVNDRFVVKGIDNLDQHAPGVLPSLWQECKQEFSIPDDLRTTVYHFGLSENTGLIHSFRYASTEKFQSYRFDQYGVLAKPECTFAAQLSPLDDIVKMMTEQRAIQATKPKDDRVYVGGEIHIQLLSREGFKCLHLASV